MSATTAGVGVDELERAWRAVRAGQFRAGQFRAERSAVDGWVSGSGGPDLIPAPVVLVAGAHGWSGTSTTALLIADAAARRGTAVRLVDVAAPARSGFAAAAATEHGLDESGRWRQGSRGPVSVQRLAGPVNRPAAVPPPPTGPDGTVTVVDVGWPISDLLEDLDGDPAGRCWLGALLRSAPLVLTARATIPGLRHVDATVDALAAVRVPGARVVLALLGPATRPRLLSASTAVQGAQREQLLVSVPDRPALTRAGLTPAPLPRQLHPAGDQLLALSLPLKAQAPAAGQRPRRRLGLHLISQFDTDRKDGLR